MRQSARMLACVGLMVPALSACSDDGSRGPTAPQAGREVMQTLCLGPLLFDMPAGVEAATRSIFAGETGYELGPLRGMAATVRIGTILLEETRTLTEEEFGREVRPSAVGYQEVDLRERHYKLSDADFRQMVQPLNLRIAHAVGWKAAGSFTAAAWSQRDGRVRWLEGAAERPSREPRANAAMTKVIESLWARFVPRAAADIPDGGGLCTPYGMVKWEPGKRPEPFEAQVPYGSKRQPALVYTLSISPAPAEPGYQRIDDAPRGWKETADETKKRRQQDKARGSWVSFGPEALVEQYLEPEYLEMAGQRARLTGAKFRKSMDQYEYELVVETKGELGDPSKPRIVLMVQGLKADYYRDLKGQPPAPPMEDVLPLLKSTARSMQPRAPSANRK